MQLTTLRGNSGCLLSGRTSRRDGSWDDLCNQVDLGLLERREARVGRRSVRVGHRGLSREGARAVSRVVRECCERCEGPRSPQPIPSRRFVAIGPNARSIRSDKLVEVSRARHTFAARVKTSLGGGLHRPDLGKIPRSRERETRRALTIWTLAPFERCSIDSMSGRRATLTGVDSYGTPPKTILFETLIDEANLLDEMGNMVRSRVSAVRVKGQRSGREGVKRQRVNDPATTSGNDCQRILRAQSDAITD